MKKTFKKLVSIVLTLVLICSLAAPVFAAEEAKSEDLPIINIGGRSSVIYKVNENGGYDKIYPRPEYEDEVALVGEWAKELAPELLFAYGVDSDAVWQKYCDHVYDLVAPMFETIQLDKDANAEEGTDGWDWNYLTSYVSNKKSNYGMNDYIFQYDWRVDPFLLADRLDVYIDRVLAATGKSQVKIFAHCLGAETFSAYITDDERAAKVHSVVYSVPSSEESMTISALFSGNLKVDAKSLDAYCTYYLSSDQNRFLTENSDFTSLVMTFVSLMKQVEVLGLGANELQFIIDRCVDKLCPKLVRNAFFFPSYWAMIGDDYEEAKDYIFSTKELKEEYATYIEKIDNYHYNVQVNIQDTIKQRAAEGMNVSFIARYGANLLPINEGCMVLGDGRIEVSSLSYGATTSDIDNTLSQKYGKSYLTKAKENGTIKYISADEKIDASTCAFPDSTWFVRNLYHAGSPAVYDLAQKIFAYPGQATIESFEEYPQYINYNADGTFSPVTKSNSADIDSKWTTNTMQALIRFITSLLKMFASLISSAQK